MKASGQLMLVTWIARRMQSEIAEREKGLMAETIIPGIPDERAKILLEVICQRRFIPLGISVTDAFMLIRSGIATPWSQTVPGIQVTKIGMELLERLKSNG